MPDIQVFGRRAGMAAAEHARDAGVQPGQGLGWAKARAAQLETSLGRNGMRPVEVKRQIQKLMWDHVGLVRCGDKLRSTLQAFSDIRQSVLPQLAVTGRSRVLNREWMEMIELENMLDIGESMASAALAREETRGAHYRTDFPGIDPAWCLNLVVGRRNGRLNVTKTPLMTFARDTAPAFAAE